MANEIRIKRSAATATPASLVEGELAYSFNSNSLFIGNSSSGVYKIGGGAYQYIDGVTPGTLAASKALVANSTGYLDTINVATIVVGNSTINAVINSTSIKVMNSSVNTVLSIPTSAQWTGGNYYLNANGSWTTVSSTATPGGSNTHVQFNDSTAMGGSAGFIFDKSTNIATVSNTFQVGSSRITSINNSILTSNNAGFSIEQTNDTYGATGFVLQNRDGVNGVLFYQSNTNIPLVEMVFRANSSQQRNIRLEARTTEVHLQLPEFQIGPPSKANTFVCIANTGTLIRNQMLMVGNSTQNVVTTNTQIKIQSNSTSNVALTTSQIYFNVNSTAVFYLSYPYIKAQKGSGSGTEYAQLIGDTGEMQLFSNSTGNSFWTGAAASWGMLTSSNTNGESRSAGIYHDPPSMGLSNSSSNVTITIPTAAQWTAGTYYLNANGSWTTVTASAAPGGSNTHVQFNDSGATSGNSLFTFDKSAKIVAVGNSTSNVQIFGGGYVYISNSTVNTSFLITKTALANDSVVGLSTTATINDQTIEAPKAYYGHVNRIDLNTKDANTLGTAQGSDSFGFYSQVFNSYGTPHANSSGGSLTGFYSDIRNYASGSAANTIDSASGFWTRIGPYATTNKAPITAAYGTRIDIGPANTTVGGNIATAYAHYALIRSNTASQVETGYLFYGSFTGTTGTKRGLWLVGDDENQITGNLQIGTAQTSVVIINSGSALAAEEIVRVNENANTYSELNIKNANSGTNASGDLTLTTNDGTATTGFLNLGINSNTYSNASFASGPRDGYLYTSNSNLFIGTAQANDIIFHANGTTSSQEIVRITPTGLLFPTSNVAATTSGKVTIFAEDSAGLPMPAIFRSGDVYSKPIQTNLGRTRWLVVQPTNAATTTTLIGCTFANTLATTARTTATTNLFTQTRRLGVASNTTAGTSAEIRIGTAGNHMLGNAAGSGGFWLNVRFGVAVVAAQGRFFTGFKNSTAVLSNGALTSQTNIIGIGYDSGETVLKIITANATVNNTASLGAGFDVSSGNSIMYDFTMYAPPNSTTVKYKVIRLDNGNVASGTFPAPSPVVNTLMQWKFWVNNGSTAGAHGVDFAGMWCESEHGV